MIAKRTACSFSTGSVPGSARSTAQACVFGCAPKAALAPEKIFDCVESCTCTSRPITVSHCIRRPSLQNRRAPVPVGHLLEAVRDIEQSGLAEIAADQLQAGR